VLKNPVAVVNKTGAAGAVGMQFVATSKPDGYTLLLALSSISIIPEADKLFGRPPAFTVDQFAPIALISADPTVLVVRAESPWKTAREFIEDARKRAGQISYSSSGIYGTLHMAMELLSHPAGIKLRHIPQTGAGPALTAILGGHVDVAFDNVGSVFKRIRSGELRALAVMDPRRSHFIPDVPTTPELGFPTVISNSTRGIAAPKGTPASVVKKLQEIFKRAMDDPEHVKRMEEGGLTLRIMIGEEYAKYYRELHAKAAKYTEWARSRPHK
jgi:tripartite-type tricarboxylate transporter receptor subunit TctC